MIGNVESPNPEKETAFLLLGIPHNIHWRHKIMMLGHDSAGLLNPKGAPSNLVVAGDDVYTRHFFILCGLIEQILKTTTTP